MVRVEFLVTNIIITNLLCIFICCISYQCYNLLLLFVTKNGFLHQNIISMGLFCFCIYMAYIKTHIASSACLFELETTIDPHFINHAPRIRSIESKFPLLPRPPHDGVPRDRINKRYVSPVF